VVNLILGTLLLAYLLAFCVFVMVDIHDECEWQTLAAERDGLLDELWADDDLAESA
jgi:hypothetical protein